MLQRAAVSKCIFKSDHGYPAFIQRDPMSWYLDKAATNAGCHKYSVCSTPLGQDYCWPFSYFHPTGLFETQPFWTGPVMLMLVTLNRTEKNDWQVNRIKRLCGKDAIGAAMGAYFCLHHCSSIGSVAYQLWSDTTMISRGRYDHTSGGRYLKIMLLQQQRILSFLFTSFMFFAILHHHFLPGMSPFCDIQSKCNNISVELQNQGQAELTGLPKFACWNTAFCTYSLSILHSVGAQIF